MPLWPIELQKSTLEASLSLINLNVLNVCNWRNAPIPSWTLWFFVNGAGLVREGVPFQTHLLRYGEDHEVDAGSAGNISIDRHRTFAALQCGVQGRRFSSGKGFFNNLDICVSERCYRKKQDNQDANWAGVPTPSNTYFVEKLFFWSCHYIEMKTFSNSNSWKLFNEFPNYLYPIVT